MTPTRAILLALAILLVVPSPAHADATAFIGANFTPSNRLAKGFAVEIGLVIVGFEFEYPVTSEDATAKAPGLKTGMGNVIVQSPVPIFGFQPYFTIGAGVYREELGTREETGAGMNTGAGVKIALVGPLRLRVDYRVFNLGSGALNSPAHRLYTGLNLAF